VSVESGDRPDARRAFETALTRALASAHGAVGGAVDAEVLEGSVAVVSGGGGSSSGAVNAVSAGHDTPTDTVHLAGVVKAPASAEAKIVSALALCHPNRARVVARAADLVALGLDARAATRRAVMGA
jgi:hypothetical protein